MKKVNAKIEYLEFRAPVPGELRKVYLQISIDEADALDLYDSFVGNGEVEISFQPVTVKNFKPNYETR